MYINVKKISELILVYFYLFLAYANDEFPNENDPSGYKKEVQVGTDHERAQSERNPHFENRGGKTKLTITYLYLENIS